MTVALTGGAGLGRVRQSSRITAWDDMYSPMRTGPTGAGVPALAPGRGRYPPTVAPFGEFGPAGGERQPRPTSTRRPARQPIDKQLRGTPLDRAPKAPLPGAIERCSR